MKEVYETPEVTIIEFEAEDTILMMSNPDIDEGEFPDPFG